MKIRLNLHKCLFFILFVSSQFHHIIIDFFPFYRDCISFFYICLICCHLKKKQKSPKLSFDFWSTYAFFLLLLIIESTYDSNYRLYGNDIKVATATSFVSEDFVVFYILRNAFLFFPIITYYFLNRGVLSREFLRFTFWSYLTLVPISVYFYTQNIFEVDLTINNLLLYGQVYIPYNTYVPHLALPAIFSMYLLYTSKNLFLKIFSFLIFLIIAGYSFVSGSRQSVIFLFFILFTFFRNSSIKHFLIMLILISLSIMITSSYVLKSFEINKEVVSKFIERDDALLESSRFGKITYGFSLLKPHEFVLGAGLSSVPDGGPHNDFVRWIQRTGILVGLFGFLPFFLLYILSIRMFKRTNDNIYLITCLSSFFLFFTSIFGYPRDDTYQSMLVFIGPMIYYGYKKQ